MVIRFITTWYYRLFNNYASNILFCGNLDTLIAEFSEVLTFIEVIDLWK